MSNSEQQVNLPINVTFSLLENKCLSFKLTEYGETNDNPVAFDSYEFVFNVNDNINESTKEIRVNLSCKMYQKQGQNIKTELAELNSLAVFIILNFNEVVLKDSTNNNFLIPNPVLEIINGISISSVRGMFSVKLENTLYSNAVVPILDPRLLVPKQLFPVK